MFSHQTRSSLSWHKLQWVHFYFRNICSNLSCRKYIKVKCKQVCVKNECVSVVYRQNLERVQKCLSALQFFAFFLRHLAPPHSLFFPSQKTFLCLLCVSSSLFWPFSVPSSHPFSLLLPAVAGSASIVVWGSGRAGTGGLLCSAKPLTPCLALPWIMDWKNTFIF